MAALALPDLSYLTSDLLQTWPEAFFRLAWRFGPQAAFLFVFLSGFMVAGPLFDDLQAGRVMAAHEFFSKRMRRIAPVAICAVLLTAVIDALSHTAPGAEELYRHSYFYDMISAFNITSFLGNLLFLQPIAVESFGSNGPLWTLGYIVQYYVLGWVFCWAFNRFGSVALLGLFIALLLMSLVRAEWAILFIAWLTGGVTRRLDLRLSPRLSLLCLVAATAIFVLSNLAPPLAAAAASIPIGMLLTGGALPFFHLPSLFTPAWLRGLSNNSYTLYAIHHPVLMSVYAVGFEGRAGMGLSFALYVLVAGVSTLVISELAGRIAKLMTCGSRVKTVSSEDNR